MFHVFVTFDLVDAFYRIWSDSFAHKYGKVFFAFLTISNIEIHTLKKSHFL